MAAPSGRFHNSLPWVLMHRQTTSLPSTQVRKTRSPQMAGVEVPLPGSANFQAMLSVALHDVGRLFSVQMPLLSGPRHCGQLSAQAMFTAMKSRHADSVNRKDAFTAGYLGCK